MFVGFIHECMVFVTFSLLSPPCHSSCVPCLLEFSNFFANYCAVGFDSFYCHFVFEVGFHCVSMVNLNSLSITGWP